MTISLVSVAKFPLRWNVKTIAGLLFLRRLGLTSCDLLRTSGPAFAEDGVSVDARSGQLVLKNESSARIHYVALEEETSTRVDLYFDPEKWRSVAPGDQVRIPYSDLMGYKPSARQARVYWWTRGEYKQHIVTDLR
jgi:hypothetical protein